LIWLCQDFSYQISSLLLIPGFLVMKKVFLLACGLSGMLGCLNLMGQAAQAETISVATATQPPQEVALPDLDVEPLPPAGIESKTPEALLVVQREVADVKPTAVETKTSIASPIAPKFVRVPMHSRIFPAMFQ
jgi:hypothetical protein